MISAQRKRKGMDRLLVRLHDYMTTGLRYMYLLVSHILHKHIRGLAYIVPFFLMAHVGRVLGQGGCGDATGGP